jgi:hypothetical protein
MRTLLILTFAASLVPSVHAAEKDVWYAKAVKKLEASVEPAEAKAGQTVTVKLMLELVDGYHTYPTKQVDPNAANFVNKLVFQNSDSLIFVGETKNPDKFESKMEPELMIVDLRQLKGTIVYEQKAVVSPKAAVGDTTMSIKDFRLSVCDASNCFPPKKLTPSAKFKVIAGSVDVAKEYADAVKKALEQ